MTTSDSIAIVLAFILLFILYTVFWQNQTHATRAIIESPNSPDMVVPLDQDRQLRVKGDIGISVIDINKERIRFSESPCRSKYCVHRGWLQYQGEVMACLPNKVIIRLSGGKSRFDSINY